MVKLIAENKKALHDFEIEETFEAGIRLTGAEMKSVRQKRVDLRQSFVKIINKKPLVLNLKIHQYPFSSERDYDPERTRQLLLQKREIAHLESKDKEKGRVIVPLKFHLKNNIAKLLLGVGKRRQKYDKRQALKEHESQRQVERELKDWKTGPSLKLLLAFFAKARFFATFNFVPNPCWFVAFGT